MTPFDQLFMRTQVIHQMRGKCIPCLSAYLPTKCREWFLLSRLWYVYLYYNQTDNWTFGKLFPNVKHFQKGNFSFFWNFTIKIRRIGSSWKSFFEFINILRWELNSGLDLENSNAVFLFQHALLAFLKHKMA